MSNNNRDKNINKLDNYIIDTLHKNRRKELKVVPLLDGIEEIKQDISERLEQGEVTYGIEILDDNVETIRKGSVTMVVARPNTGKSQIGLNIAAHLAKMGKLVLICSCEMGAGLFMERELKTLMGVSMKELTYAYKKDSNIADNLLNNIYEKEAYAYLQNISICETGGATVYDIIDMLETCPEYEYIIIDYIQRIKGAGTDYENISKASSELQTFARRTKRSLVICSQANRQSQSQDGKSKPSQVGGVQGKGSGSIEEDADVIISLSEQIVNDEKIIYIELTKNRFGYNKGLIYRYKFTPRLQYEYIGRAE